MRTRQRHGQGEQCEPHFIRCTEQRQAHDVCNVQKSRGTRNVVNVSKRITKHEDLSEHDKRMIRNGYTKDAEFERSVP